MNTCAVILLVIVAFALGWFSGRWALLCSLNKLTKFSAGLDKSTDSLAESISRNKQTKGKP